MISRQIKQRMEVSESRRLTWYAALFDCETTITGEGTTYTEVLRHGCFADSLKDRTINVTANIDHDDTFLFAQTFDGSLLLQEDPKGLFCSCWLPDNQLGDDIIRKVTRGQLDGASFRFAPMKDRSTGDYVERLAVKLADCCITSSPAYPQTEGEVMVRTGLDQLKVRSVAARLRLLKAKGKNLV